MATIPLTCRKIIAFSDRNFCMRFFKRQKTLLQCFETSSETGMIVGKKESLVQDPVLRAWLEIYFRTKRYQF